MSSAERDHWYLIEEVAGWSRADATTNHGVTIRKTTLFGETRWIIDWGSTATAGCRTEAKAIRVAERARALRREHDAQAVSAVAAALTNRWPPGWEPNGNWYHPCTPDDEQRQARRHRERGDPMTEPDKPRPTLAELNAMFTAMGKGLLAGREKAVRPFLEIARAANTAMEKRDAGGRPSGRPPAATSTGDSPSPTRPTQETP